MCVLTGQDLADVDPYFGSLRDRPAVAIDMVRFVGEPVAAVAALDELTAFEALELIEVEYEELEPVLDVHAALAGELPPIHGGDDAAEAKWVRLARVPQMQSQMFEDHFHIVDWFLGGG